MAAGNAKIQFLGRISDTELVANIQACDVYCFPSITKNEAFGLALAEGMYFGKPTVTFTINGSGVNYVSINGVTGIEVPNRDTRAFAEAMKMLADDSALRSRYGENAKERVIENFLFETYRMRIQELFKKL